METADAMVSRILSHTDMKSYYVRGRLQAVNITVDSCEIEVPKLLDMYCAGDEDQWLYGDGTIEITVFILYSASMLP